MRKRGFRTVWVFALNSFVVDVIFTRLFGEPFNPAAQTPQLWREFVLEAALPIIGIVLELINSKFARWMNVGYLALAGAYWLEETVRWGSDSYLGVLLILAVILLTMSGITESIY